MESSIFLHPFRLPERSALDKSLATSGVTRVFVVEDFIKVLTFWAFRPARTLRVFLPPSGISIQEMLGFACG